MDSIKKANLLIIFIVAILGFGISNIVAPLTEEYVNLEMPNFNNEPQKLIAVDDGNFSPNHINKVIVNTTNNNTTNDNNTPVNNSSNTTLIDDLNYYLQDQEPFMSNSST